MINQSREGEFSSIIDENSLSGVTGDLDSLEILDTDGPDRLGGDADVQSEESLLKQLIERGKKQGYLTYEQLANYLPEDLSESEEVESIVQMFEEMGITIYEETPESDAMAS